VDVRAASACRPVYRCGVDAAELLVSCHSGVWPRWWVMAPACLKARLCERACVFCCRVEQGLSS
jgi:hypothetical protein